MYMKPDIRICKFPKSISLEGQEIWVLLSLSSSLKSFYSACLVVRMWIFESKFYHSEEDCFDNLREMM